MVRCLDFYVFNKAWEKKYILILGGFKLSSSFSVYRLDFNKVKITYTEKFKWNGAAWFYIYFFSILLRVFVRFMIQVNIF